MKKNGLLEQEAVAMIWSAVMSAVEWNKKEDLLQEQVCIMHLLYKFDINFLLNFRH